MATALSSVFHERRARQRAARLADELIKPYAVPTPPELEAAGRDTGRVIETQEAPRPLARYRSKLDNYRSKLYRL